MRGDASAGSNGGMSRDEALSLVRRLLVANDLGELLALQEARGAAEA
ncbi:hypothetical protein G3M53_69190 [Streptomyces sp. SID7982]|nr:hypothetical protein [Streptomyces sp. SID7982]